MTGGTVLKRQVLRALVALIARELCVLARDLDRVGKARDRGRLGPILVVADPVRAETAVVGAVFDRSMTFGAGVICQDTVIPGKACSKM